MYKPEHVQPQTNRFCGPFALPDNAPTWLIGKTIEPKVLHPDTIQRQSGGQLIKSPVLHAVAEIEIAIQRRAPLPVSYDVNRPQPWFFEEFGYTEYMGGIYIYPMCDELASRIVEDSRKDRTNLDVESLFKERRDKLGTNDKYTLAVAPYVKEVAILPGSNQLATHISREILTRVIWENPDVMIKPHPLTSEPDFRELQKAYGTRRVLHPKVSGWMVMNTADIVYCASSTELASYAVLEGKPIRNIGNIFHERTGSYYPVFRLIADVPVKQAQKNLRSILSSASSGILFSEDPQWSDKLDAFFSRAMKLRQKFKPRVYNSFDRPPASVNIPKPIPKPIVKTS